VVELFGGFLIVVWISIWGGVFRLEFLDGENLFGVMFLDEIAWVFKFWTRD
jgi:hypothetical protein